MQKRYEVRDWGGRFRVWDTHESKWAGVSHSRPETAQAECDRRNARQEATK